MVKPPSLANANDPDRFQAVARLRAVRGEAEASRAMDTLEREVRRHEKRMSAALALAAYKNSELFSFSFDRLTQAVGGLLKRAIAAGATGPAPCSRGHVLHERSARLGDERSAPCRRIHRRATYSIR
jgi:hypothetical protein